MQSTTTSHPDQPVRHSYPLAVSEAGFSSSLGLLLQTLPYALVRFGILFAFSVTSLLWYGITFGGGAFLGSRVPLLGYAWTFSGLGVWGYVYWFVVRYFLYLLKAGHIAVLTELITSGRIQNGQEGMFQYGTRVVKERFGEVNVLFAFDALIKGVVGVFNRTLDWISSLIPIPGLSSLTNLVTAVVRAATTYIDETLFSYNLARGDENKWRGAKDGLVYYAQNHREILKTSAYIVGLDWVLTFVIWLVCLVPAGVIAWVLPPNGVGQFGVLLLAAFAASNLRAAFLRPLFLTMVMVKFHLMVKGQPINLEWDAKLTNLSDKFREIKSKISEAPTVPNTSLAAAPPAV